jgi:ATP-dependent Lon protease
MPDFEATSAEQSGALRPISIPHDAVPVVPVRNTVLFPGMLAPMTLSAPSSVAAAQQAVREQRQIGILLQQDSELGEAGPDDLYRRGTIANVIRYLTGLDDTHHVVCQGCGGYGCSISSPARRS